MEDKGLLYLIVHTADGVDVAGLRMNMKFGADVSSVAL